MAVYEADEVARHRQDGDLWLTSGGKVYDVSSFAAGKHPGGSAVLLEHAGQDVSELMNASKPHSHSKSAFIMMEKYCIGSLAGYSNGCNGSSPSRQTSNGTATENGTGNSHKKDIIPNDLIDLNKPMFWQIGKLKEKYIEWVFTSSDKDLRFFESDFLEKLTMCQWPVIPIFWSPIILLFIYLSFSNFSSNGNESFLFGSVGVWQMPLLLAFGILMWTFFEYVIHRWVFHLVPPASSWFLTTIHFLFHGQHHKNPMNKDRLVFPPLPAAPFAFVIYHIVHLIFPRATAQCIIAGVAIGYVFYDLTHYYLHHGSPTSRYWKELKAFHIKHHYSEPNYGFGISSKLWDYPFGTLFPDDTKTKSN